MDKNRSILILDRVWGDVRLPKARYANDIDGGGLGSIDLVGVGSIVLSLDSIALCMGSIVRREALPTNVGYNRPRARRTNKPCHY